MSNLVFFLRTVFSFLPFHSGRLNTLHFTSKLNFFKVNVRRTLYSLPTSVNISCRRFVWNFFRLENEHLNNCGKFRAVRDISVAPIDSSDQSQIIRMMDEEDGVIHHRQKKPPRKVKEDKQKLLAEEPVEELSDSPYIEKRL